MYQQLKQIHNCWRIINFRPKTSVKDGIKEFVKWYRSFYVMQFHSMNKGLPKLDEVQQL